MSDKRLRQVGLLFVVLFCGVLLGCAQERVVEVNTAVPTQSPTAQATATLPTPTTQPTPSQTSTPMPTTLPTPTATASPTTTPVPLPDIPDTLQGLETWLSTHWQQQTDPELIQFSLEQAGWMTRFATHVQHVPLEIYDREFDYQFAIFDLDGNGTDEWIVTLVMCQSESKPWAPKCEFEALGNLWIINEDGLVYQTYSELSSESLLPISIVFVDLTGDGRNDLTTFAQFRNNTAYYNDYWAITGHFGEIENAVYTFHPDEAVTMLSGSVSFADETNDDVLDLVLSGGAYASAGAGPQRGRSEIWSWNGRKLSLYERRDHRIRMLVHALYYANEQYSKPDLMMADSWYARIIFDENLKEYRMTGEERAIAQQFAAFRLILLNLHRHAGHEDAVQWFNWLQENFPDQPLTHTANLLLTEWEKEQNLTLACDAVTPFLLEEDLRIKAEGSCDLAPCGLLNPIEVVGTYGVNPELHAEDLCKVPGQ